MISRFVTRSKVLSPEISKNGYWLCLLISALSKPFPSRKCRSRFERLDKRNSIGNGIRQHFTCMNCTIMKNTARTQHGR